MRTLSLTMLPLVFSILTGCASEDKHQVLSADNIAISYDIQGTGKPALVFVHGWCCDKSYWKYQVPHFAKRHKVITIDLAGHGESGLGREKWTIEAFGKDVAAVVEKLGLEKVILVGHSMGGAVIIEATRQIPKRIIGLVGVDTFQNFETEYTQEQIDEFLGPFKISFAESTKKFVRGMFPANADSELVEWIASDMSSARPEVGIGALVEYLHYDFKEALKDARKPIYCINSDMRPINIEAGRRYALSFKVKVMPGVGHFVMMEDPEIFNQLLTETISELSR